MVPFFQRKRVRAFLKAFKWCRVAVLFAVFLVVAALSYLYSVGLPGYLKKPLLSSLRRRGFEAQFVNARLRWGPAILIENAAFSTTNQNAGPRLSAGWTQLNLNAAAFFHARLRVDSFEVQQASLLIPVSPTNQPPLSLTDVNLRVRLGSNGVAVLNDCSAWCLGVRLHINGEIDDFHSIRAWKIPLPSPAAATAAHPPPIAAEAAARPSVWEILRGIHFTGTPDLNLNFYADGLDRNSLRAELRFSAQAAQTPWGQAGPLELSAVCARLLHSGDAPLFHASLLASNVDTPWAKGRDLALSVDFSRYAETNISALAHLSGHEASAEWKSPLASHWVRVAGLRWDGSTTFPSPAFAPASFEGTLRLTDTKSDWGSVGAASLVLQSRRAETSPPSDPAWGQWNLARPFTVDWQADATNILTPKLNLDRVAFKGGWHPPRLTIEALDALMYHGHLNAGGTLDVASREVQARADVGFDPHQIAPLLTAPAQRWISFYDWAAPPNINAGIRFVLPPWTNRIDVWPEDSLNSLQLGGDFSIGQGAFRGIGVRSARSHFSYTNRVWDVSGLRVAAEGGSLGLDYTWSERTRRYHFRFDSKLDPALAMPLLTEPQKRTLREMSFPDKPQVRGEVWGGWGVPETTGFTAALSTGPFIVRGEKAANLSAQVDYTNRFLRVSQLKLSRDEGQVEAPLAGIDFASNVISMSNASSTIDPEAVRRALGRVAPPFMSEIHFTAPPQVRASGSFRPGDDNGTDMHFFVQAGDFRWNRLKTGAVQGNVDYHIRTVNITNVTASMYKTGSLHGWTRIDWDARGATGFGSDVSFKDFNLAAVAGDWDAKHSKLEGRLEGHLELGAPLGASDTNLYGQGWLHVYDGLLWDIKIFGILSPMLNAIAPGTGNSRARDARASFTMTNGVLTTTNLEIRSTGFRLLYRGTIDTRSRLNAHVEAKLLHDTPVLGPLMSWMLLPLDKLFEYRVTGTLQKPIAEPQYIPRVFTEILRPFHTIKMMRKSVPAKPPAANSK